MSVSPLTNLINIITTAFRGRAPLSDVRLPNPAFRRNNPDSESSIVIPAVWTTDGLRPRWNNLAVVASAEHENERISQWSKMLRDIGVRLGLLLFKGSYIMLSPTSGGTTVRQIAPDALHTELDKYNDALFTPRALSGLRPGQLSFADLEESITAESFSFHFRHRARLGQALENAIDKALEVELERDGRRKTSEEDKAYLASKYNDVLMVAIAFLAARILEDKGFFGAGQLPTDNPRRLLSLTVSRINGFFKEATLVNLPKLSVDALQELALELGTRANFTLVDHRDVGQLYEQAIQMLPATLLEGIDYRASLLVLQRHYTPMAVAERMLERLPLERLRPEERRIFDPAAGSGSLLLASTRRLAFMTDIPNETSDYLAEQVSGNDIDRLSRLITQLRYSLVQESLGSIDWFPAPSHFGNKDFESFTAENLPNRPRVIVANPPFAEEENLQRAVSFVELAISWLRDGDQFAFILPQSFLSGSTHGFPTARRSLASRCHILEAWQLPEGVVGLTATQPVCVLIGEVGVKSQPSTIARAVLTRAKKDAIRSQGFLGPSWIGAIGSGSEDWSSVAAPVISIPVPTIPLGQLYDVFNGVVPNKKYKPVSTIPGGVECKRYWTLNWREAERVWADPECIDPRRRYIRYGKKYLERPREDKKALFDKPKVLIGRSKNRGSRDPLAAHLDTEGYCPNNNIYCICTWEQSGVTLADSNTPRGWRDLGIYRQLLWVLGILSSELARDLVLRMQDSRQLVAERFETFELPMHVDTEIVRVVDSMVERDRRREGIPDPDPLRQALNKAVEASYGNPRRLSLNRTGAPPELELWKTEYSHHAIVVTGQVIEVNPDRGEVRLYLDGLLDETQESWVPLPPELPGWALDGHVFTADLSGEVETFEALSKRPWALRNFKHTPLPYLTIDELDQQISSIKQGKVYDL